MTQVKRASDVNKPIFREADPAIDKSPAAKPAPPLPEPKRTKAERTHEAKGYHQGVWHGMLLGGAAVVVFALILVTTVMVSSADFAAKLRMIDTARDAALGGR